MAIFRKDMKDLVKNIYVATTLLVPLIIAIAYSQMGMNSLEMHYTVINLTFASVTGFVQCILIAEEKEKNTLRSLILSPANTWEILGGKSILTFLFTAGTLLACIWITGYSPGSILPIALALFLSIFFYLGLGTLLGLWMKSVMEASVAILPVMFLFGFSTMIQQVLQDYPALFFLDYLPNLQLLEIAKSVEEGSPFGDIIFSLLIIALWTIAINIFVLFGYRRSSLDD